MVLHQYYEASPCPPKPDLFTKLISGSESDPQLSETVVAFARTMVTRERDILTGKMLIDARTPKQLVAAAHRWTIRLAQLLLQRERHEEAYEVMDGTLGCELELTTMQNQGSAAGLARKLIKMYKAQSNQVRALDVRRRVFESLHSRAPVADPPYRAWTKDYVRELELAGQYAEALSVSAQVWTQLKRTIGSSRDSTLIYHTRNVAWAVARSYRMVGKDAEAEDVRSVYESMACVDDGKTRYLWPQSGMLSCTEREGSGIRGNSDLPIIA